MARTYHDEPWFKLSRRLFESSVWEEDLVTRLVWITLLASAQELPNLAHGEGTVIITPGNLARKALISREQLDHAIERLTTPDPTSRTNPGEPRLEVLPNGYRIPAFEQYNDRRNFERFRERQIAAGKARAARGKRVNGRFVREEEAE